MFWVSDDMKSGLESGAFWQDVVFGPVPERDQQLPGQSDDSDFSQAFGAGAEASLIPETEGGAWLKPEPGPCDFDSHAADPFVAGLVDALLSIGFAAVKRCWSEPDQGPDLFTILELSRGEELGGEGPGTVYADAAEAVKLVSDLSVLGLAFGKQPTSFYFDDKDL